MPELEDVIAVLIRNTGHVRSAWTPEDSVVAEEWLEEWEDSKPPVVQAAPKTPKGGTK